MSIHSLSSISLSSTHPTLPAYNIPLHEYSHDVGTTVSTSSVSNQHAYDLDQDPQTYTPTTHPQVSDNVNIAPVEAIPAKQIWSYPRMNRWRIAAACLQCFGNGANDSAPGAIITAAEAYYNVDYSVMAMIFVAIAVGFISAAFCVDAVDRRLRRSYTLALCDLISIAGYVMMVVTPPYPVYVLGYLFCGFGQAINLALNNVYCANFANSTVILGFYHGLYGIGGALAPIIATAIISAGHIFTRFYIFMICLRAVSGFFTCWAFWGLEHDAENLQRPATAAAAYTTTARADDESRLNMEENRNESIHDHSSKQQILKQSLKQRTTIIGALFIFAYQGAEVTNAGWISSFLIDIRHGNPKSMGYVPSGFWAGIAVGRLLLSYIAFRYVGEVPFTYAVVFAALGMQLVCWLVPNVIGSATAVALIGLFIGPIYPCATTLFSHQLDRSLQETAIAFITSSGSAGGAVLPLITGVVSQSTGMWVLQPICMALFAMMEVCWAGLSWGQFRKLRAE